MCLILGPIPHWMFSGLTIDSYQFSSEQINCQDYVQKRKSKDFMTVHTGDCSPVTWRDDSPCIVGTRSTRDMAEPNLNLVVQGEPSLPIDGRIMFRANEPVTLSFKELSLPRLCKSKHQLKQGISNVLLLGGKKKNHRFQYPDRPMAKTLDPKNFPGLSRQNICLVNFINFFHSLFTFFSVCLC